MSLMEIRELTHIYSRGTPFENTAIDNLNLSLDAGQTIGLIGHTGSGKSTLIQHMNALLKPTSGTVILDGADIFASKAAIRDARFRVGLVFQYPEYQLFEETVRADIAFGPKNQKLPPEEIDRRVQEAAAFVGLSETLFDQSPLELSGGQKRRVAIAGVLAMEPEILILDEPSAGLDPMGRHDLFRNLRQWRQAKNATTLLVTHDMTTAAQCDRLIVMDHGRIFMTGTPGSVFSHAAELQALGLDLPGPASMALRLRAKGLSLPDTIYTTEQLRDALLALRGKGGASC